MMKPVSGATNDSSSSGAAGSNSKKYACMAALLVAFFFVVSLSSGNNNHEGGDSLRSGQAKRPTIHDATHLPDPIMAEDDEDGTTKKKKKKSSAGQDFDADTNTGANGANAGAVEEMDEEAEVQKATDHFTRAIQDQLANNQNAIANAIAIVTEQIRNNLETLLGDDDHYDLEDIATLGNRMEDKLSDTVQATLQTKSDLLKQDKVVDMETTADLDTEGKENPGDQDPIDLKDEEQQLVIELRDGVDDICSDVKADIPRLGGLVEQELLEVSLKTKVGLGSKSYTVTLDTDTNLVTGFKLKKSSSSSSSTIKKTSSSTTKKKTGTTTKKKKKTSTTTTTKKKKKTGTTTKKKTTKKKVAPVEEEEEEDEERRR